MCEADRGGGKGPLTWKPRLENLERSQTPSRPRGHHRLMGPDRTARSPGPALSPPKPPALASWWGRMEAVATGSRRGRALSPPCCVLLGPRSGARAFHVVTGGRSGHPDMAAWAEDSRLSWCTHLRTLTSLWPLRAAHTAPHRAPANAHCGSHTCTGTAVCGSPGAQAGEVGMQVGGAG